MVFSRVKNWSFVLIPCVWTWSLACQHLASSCCICIHFLVELCHNVLISSFGWKHQHVHQNKPAACTSSAATDAASRYNHWRSDEWCWVKGRKWGCSCVFLQGGGCGDEAGWGGGAWWNEAAEQDTLTACVWFSTGGAVSSARGSACVSRFHRLNVSRL